MAAVAFSYQVWAARYPELADRVAEPLAQAYFAEAGLYCKNDSCSVITDEPTRLLILNMITAHIAALNATLSDGTPMTPLVGRINSATQGSVTVQAQFDVPAGSAQWWAQTRYGASAWQAMAPYRTMRYVPGHPRQMGPWIGGYPRA